MRQPAHEEQEKSQQAAHGMIAVKSRKPGIELGTRGLFFLSYRGDYSDRGLADDQASLDARAWQVGAAGLPLPEEKV